MSESVQVETARTYAATSKNSKSEFARSNDATDNSTSKFADANAARQSVFEYWLLAKAELRKPVHISLANSNPSIPVDSSPSLGTVHAGIGFENAQVREQPNASRQVDNTKATTNNYERTAGEQLGSLGIVSTYLPDISKPLCQYADAI